MSQIIKQTIIDQVHLIVLVQDDHDYYYVISSLFLIGSNSSEQFFSYEEALEHYEELKKPLDL